MVTNKNIYLVKVFFSNEILFTQNYIKNILYDYHNELGRTAQRNLPKDEIQPFIPTKI
jgi:hypothetical protein